MHFHIITTPDCNWCKEAKKLIDRMNHSYTEEIATKENMRGFKTVPQIYHVRDKYVSEYIGGYEALKKFLGE
jgi:glutaredoxin